MDNATAHPFSWCLDCDCVCMCILCQIFRIDAIALRILYASLWVDLVVIVVMTDVMSNSHVLVETSADLMMFDKSLLGQAMHILSRVGKRVANMLT